MMPEVKENIVSQDQNIEKEELVKSSDAQTETQDKNEKPEDPNWRAFREARKRDRIEKEAAERRAAEKEKEIAALKAAMEAAFARDNSQARQQQNFSGNYEEEESEDQRIERKVQAALALREDQLRREQQQREQQEYPTKLSQSYPDFHATVTEDALDYLEYHYPEIARPLKRQSDGYEKWADIYLAVKRLVPNSSNSRKDAARAEVNLVKPRSLSSPGLSQNTEIKSTLTEAQKAANWERMQRAMKGI